MTKIIKSANVVIVVGQRRVGEGEQERQEDAKHLLGPWLQAPNLEMVQRTVKCAQSDRRLSGQSLPGVGQKLGHSNLFLVVASPPPRRPASKPSSMQEIEDFGHLPKTAISISAIITALLTLLSFDWRLRRLLLPPLHRLISVHPSGQNKRHLLGPLSDRFLFNCVPHSLTSIFTHFSPTFSLIINSNSFNSFQFVAKCYYL